jgi:hypothetical protein
MSTTIEWKATRPVGHSVNILKKHNRLRMDLIYCSGEGDQHQRLPLPEGSAADLPLCVQSEMDILFSISGHLADQSKRRNFDVIFPPEVTEAGALPDSLGMCIVFHTVCEV